MSQVDGASVTKAGCDASPVKKAAGAKEKAARKPRAKNGASKLGRKRGSGNPEATGEDDEEPMLKKNKVFEDGDKELADGKDNDSGDDKGKAAVKKGGNAGKKKTLGTNGRIQRTKKNAGEKAVSGDMSDRKHEASTAMEKGERGGDDGNWDDGDTVVVSQLKENGMLESQGEIENDEEV